MVELKYYLDRRMLMTGANYNFMKRHIGWYIYSIVTGVLLVGFGIYYASRAGRFEVLPAVLIICGVLVLLKKQLYLRRTAKGVLANKPQRQEIHCKFSEDEIWMRTGSSEGTNQWSGVYDVIIIEEGILLYPQKNLHQWIPKNAEIIQGTWEDLVGLCARASRKKVI